MKTTSKLLAMTAAITVLSAPAMAETVKTQVGEKVTYKVKSSAQPGDNVVGFQIEERQEFARLDTNNNGVVTRKEFYDNTMLDDEAEIYALFDSDQSGEITPQEFEMNSRYGNGRLTNKTTNSTKRNYSNANFGSMREKYYTVDTEEYVVVEPAAGYNNSSSVEAGIDYNGIDTEPNVNQGIDYKGEPRTPGTVDAGIDYRGGTGPNYNYN